MKWKSLSATSLLMIAFFLVSSLNLAPAVATPESPYTITEFPVATGSAAQTHPHISGNIVVWTEQPGGFGGQDSDIYALDLSTGQEFVISRDTGPQINPRISGKLVVWQDYRSGSSGDIYAYDL